MVILLSNFCVKYGEYGPKSKTNRDTTKTARAIPSANETFEEFDNAVQTVHAALGMA